MPVETQSQTVVGAYELLDKIAEGGMGAVYKARHRDTGQNVAIKILSNHLASNRVLVKRFEQEYAAAHSLKHDNLVRALDFGYDGACPYLVMELVEGESLGQRLEREGKLPEHEAIRIIGLVARGLHKAHKAGLVHRDVKPDNVLLTKSGEVKLADMGLVKEVEADNNLTRTGRGLGTPHFMAPEQFRNAKHADARCDIYSLGATLYMMVTGDLPFKSCGPLDAWMKKINNECTPPRELVPTLSDRMDWAIRRSMSPDPDQRPQTCREFVEDLTGHSTRRMTTLPNNEAPTDLWYLVYRDEEGTTHTVKGTTAGVRRSLKEGLLGDASNIKASRLKTGPFQQLQRYPEFRDLLVKPTASAPAAAKKNNATPLPKSLTGEEAKRHEPVSTQLNISTPAPIPRLELGYSSGTGDWTKWAALIFAAAAAGVGSFILLQLINGQPF